MEHKEVKYEANLARSFSKHEQKTMGWCATLGIFIIIFTISNIFEFFNVQVLTHDSLNSQATAHNGKNIAKQLYSKTIEGELVCDLKQPRSDICNASGDIRVIGNSSTILVVSNSCANNTSWNIRPYARKSDPAKMRETVRELTIEKVHRSHKRIRNCTRHYNVTAIVFSIGGYAGNLYHDFTDLLIPLYITSLDFEGEVVFLVTNSNPSWVNKYKTLLQRLSKYEVIDLDEEKDDVFCFPRMIVGLKASDQSSIDIEASDHVPPYSTKNFTEFLRRTYGLKREVVEKSNRPPRLLLISRGKTRRFLNVDKISAMARELGFEVVVHETNESVEQVAKFVNEFDVIVGVHGAGLSNMVFLPENAVVIQVIGLGMSWIATFHFQYPSKRMGLKYLDYKIGVNESSLKGQYPIGHQVLRNPPTLVHIKDWKAFSEIYLDRQDLRLDVNKFRTTLVKALQLLNT